MRILIACDSFKEALPAREVCAAVAQGLRGRAGVVAVQHPLADGGEGTLDVLASHLHLEIIHAPVCDPLHRPRTARFGLRDRTAYVELAEAIGLQLLAANERNALKTSSFGLGELLHAARHAGARNLVLTVGGSATCDAGMGMLAALGWQFLDSAYHELEPCGAHLQRIAQIRAPSSTGFADVAVLCDVNNPLYGPDGAAFCYAPQKGASAEDVAALDTGLRHFAAMHAERASHAAALPGAGAAGGIAYAAHVFFDARLLAGADYVLDATRFDAALDVDLVITGEGKLDAQSFNGKLISKVCQRAARRRIPVIALCGRVDLAANDVQRLGLHAAYDINQGQQPDLQRTHERLQRLAECVAFG